MTSAQQIASPSLNMAIDLNTWQIYYSEGCSVCQCPGLIWVPRGLSCTLEPTEDVLFLVLPRCPQL